jgi:hypothetical protein
VPAADLVIQPPGGRTLVNFPTIFVADAEPFRRTVRLLGRTVQLKIWPSSYWWDFGDGETSSTADGGRRYEAGLPMSSYITHEYADAGVAVRPQVDATYAAEFSLDGGRTWTPVGGTVTVDGARASLRVVEARPVLVGSD